MTLQGGIDNAVAKCREILQDTSSAKEQVSEAHLLLGSVCIRQGNFEAALKHLELTTEIPKPLKSRAGAFLGLALIKLKKIEEAKTLLKSLEESFPSCAYVEHALAVYFKELGNEAEAWNHIRRAILVNPSYAPVVDDLVAMGFKFGQFSEVARLLQTFVDQSPLDLNARSFLALALNLDGQVQQALREMEHILAFSVVIEMNPGVLDTIKQSFISLKSQVIA
jgi:tetratricopeptide (TPR) repeat protein